MSDWNGPQMNQTELKELLEALSAGQLTTDEAYGRLRSLPFADLGDTKVDLHRAIRHGAPEVIFCPGKTPEQVLGVIKTLIDAGQHVLATRGDQALYDFCAEEIPTLHFHERSGIITDQDLGEKRGEGQVIVVTAGTSDIPVAEEAVLTARACGSKTKALYDVGVSGLHRLLAHTEILQNAKAIIVCAGMEGALPSVVGGLVAVPVVAVPTSVGYGASFGGVAALLGMLNSCANNVTVVNIDNGFGAGYVASLINMQSVEAAKSAQSNQE